jgi:hypothetical protein
VRDSVTYLVTPSLRFDQVQQSSVLVQQSVSFPSSQCSFLCDEVGTWLVVDCLQVFPLTELILVLDFGSGAHDEINT